MKKVIETTTGTFQGFEQNSHVNFRGVPFGYAKRFKRAEKYISNDLKKVNFAIHTGTQPMQESALEKSDIFYGEDCLNLDISTPSVDGKFPIVIELFGGGFINGGNATKNMPWLDKEPIVHVMPNYRIGLFGWSVVDGGDTNVGLSDQLLALQWVIDNAQKIGGDVDNINLVGLSAGAKSISAMMASNSELPDYIKKIVLFSGSVQTIRDLSTAKKVTKRFCDVSSISNDQELFNLTDDGLLTVQVNATKGHIPTNWFGPVIDNDLISDNWSNTLVNRLKRTDFKSLISAGTNEQVLLNKYDLATLKTKVCEDLFGSNAKILLEQLPDSGNQKAALVRMIGEAMYSLPSFKTERLLSDNEGDVYGNYFSVFDGRHGGNIGYLSIQKDKLNIEYRRNRQYYGQLIMDYILNSKPYNDDIKFEWPLFDNNQLVMKLDSNDISSVSLIDHEWVKNLPWQTYKL
ncbi:carboxylesterase family protein [Companilactobacillus hulinensis]|uniref:carboxylesterase family protein n=1 Tax=Companilactobacillus hulinensis TaxID=2486007 RepID=UPI000F76B88F|nr:carboxylesterase family protein [Companilactobacillus hulinensis]